VGGILTILVVAALIFAAYKLMPPYVNNYQLQDTVETIAREATYTKMTEADIRQQVINKASDLGVELDPSQVYVERSGPSVNISTEYMITVDLLVRQVDLQFAPSAGNRNIVAK
jgi:hypothetical protein